MSGSLAGLFPNSCLIVPLVALLFKRRPLSLSGPQGGNIAWHFVGTERVLAWSELNERSVGKSEREYHQGSAAQVRIGDFV